MCECAAYIHTLHGAFQKQATLLMGSYARNVQDDRRACEVQSSKAKAAKNRCGLHQDSCQRNDNERQGHPKRLCRCLRTHPCCFLGNAGGTSCRQTAAVTYLTHASQKQQYGRQGHHKSHDGEVQVILHLRCVLCAAHFL